jgi:hypothetical protein
MMRSLLSRLYQNHVFSIIFLVSPYLIQNFHRVYNSAFFSWIYFFLTLITIVLLQVFFSFLSDIKKKYISFIIALSYLAIFILFYGGDIVNLGNQLQEKVFGFQRVRGRVQLLFLALFIFYFFQSNYFRHHKGLVRFINIYFIFFTFFSLVFYSYAGEKIVIGQVENSYKKFSSHKDKNKSIILIILDEYSSPVELAKYSSKSEFADFGNRLKRQGWFVKEELYSSETSTIHSIASLFNFNLSLDTNFSKKGIESLSLSELKRPLLLSNMTSVGVKFHNFGIFDLEDSKPLTRVYFYPKTFFEVLMASSVLSHFYFFSMNNVSELEPNFFATTKQNNSVFNSLRNLNIGTKKEFVYAHILMPHAPFSYNDEFEFRPTTTDGYLSFWNFTNLKISPTLDFLVSSNKYKIIVTGDHGFRSEGLIDPHLTFAAFYGFDDKSLSEISSVQDLGSLISAQFD